MSVDVIVESEHPVLMEHFLNNAAEADIDAIANTYGDAIIGGIMEHIEVDDIHVGDSIYSLPTISIPHNAMTAVRSWTISLARQLDVIDLMNMQ